MLDRIIISGGYGRTCNQLFQITRWIPAAISLGAPLYFPSFRRYAKLFAGTHDAGMPRYPRGAPPLPCSTAMIAWLLSGVNRVSPGMLSACLRLAGRLPGNVMFELDDSGRDGLTTTAMVVKQERIAEGRTLWIKGWLYRDPEGVRTHEAAIREFFAPIPPVAKRIASFIEMARHGREVLVGVHLRRGDYRKWDDGKYYYDDATFCRVMRQIEAALPHRSVRFLLVSNESIDRSKYAAFDVVVGLGNSVGDLYSLAGCDYIIGPPSTYTSWASWYEGVPLYHMKDLTTPVRLEYFKSAR